MKHYLFLIITILFLSISSFSFANSNLINCVYTYKDSVWYKTQYEYNTDKKIVSTTTYISKDKNDWTNHAYCTKQYTNSVVSEVCDYKWNDTTWIVERKHTYTYANNKLATYILNHNNETQCVTYGYHDSLNIEIHKFMKNDTLEYEIQTISKFNDNKISYIKTTSFSPSNDTLFSHFSTIDYQDNQTTTTSYQLTDSEYVAYSKTIQYFNINNQLDCEVQYVNANGIWTNSAKQTYTYTHNGLLSSTTYQYWNTNFWESSYKQHYTYNGDNTLCSSGFSAMIYKEWQLLYQIQYEYTSTGKVESAQLHQTFWSERKQSYNDYIFLNSPICGMYIHANQLDIVYSDTLTDTNIDILSPIDIYPNPSNGVIFLNTDLQIYKIAVHDINGKLLMQLPYTNVGSINLTHLNNGFYFIQITTNQGIYTFKQIITNN